MVVLLGKLFSISEDNNIWKRIKYNVKIIQVVSSFMWGLKHKAIQLWQVSAVGERGAKVFLLLLSIVHQTNMLDLFSSAAQEWLFVSKMKISLFPICMFLEMECNPLIVRATLIACWHRKKKVNWGSGLCYWKRFLRRTGFPGTILGGETLWGCGFTVSLRGWSKSVPSRMGSCCPPSGRPTSLASLRSCSSWKLILDERLTFSPASSLARLAAWWGRLVLPAPWGRLDPPVHRERSPRPWDPLLGAAADPEPCCLHGLSIAWEPVELCVRKT